MSRVRVFGAALVVLLGCGRVDRIINRAGMPPKNPAHPPVELPALEGQPVTETVDLRNGNVHLEIPIRAVHQKTAAPLSRH